MLQNFTATSIANTAVTIIPAQSNELLLLSLFVNGGANGGDVTITYPNGFTSTFAVVVDDTFYIDSPVAIPAGSTLSLTATAAGIKAMASATLSLADV